MQEKTGRIEEFTEEQLKEMAESDKAALAGEKLNASVGTDGAEEQAEEPRELFTNKPSMEGDWVQLSEAEAQMLKNMNRHDRRKWLAKQKKMGRTLPKFRVVVRQQPQA